MILQPERDLSFERVIGEFVELGHLIHPESPMVPLLLCLEIEKTEQIGVSHLQLLLYESNFKVEFLFAAEGFGLGHDELRLTAFVLIYVNHPKPLIAESVQLVELFSDFGTGDILYIILD